MKPNRLWTFLLMAAAVLGSLQIADTHPLFGEQIVAVRGQLLCGTKPAPGVRIRLYDLDSEPDDPDDLLDQGETDSNGEFQLKGGTVELSPIEPVLKLYHDCGNEEESLKNGLRRVTIHIPYSHVTTPGEALRFFHVGALNLESRFDAEDREPVADKPRRHYRLARLSRDDDLFEGL